MMLFLDGNFVVVSHQHTSLRRKKKNDDSSDLDFVGEECMIDDKPCRASLFTFVISNT